MTALSTLGILFAIALVCYLAYIGYSPIISGPLAAVIICVTSRIPLKEGILSNYVGSFAGMVQNVLLIFLTCMIFARILVENKMAFSIAEFLARVIGPKYAPFTVMILCALLRLGGMNQGAYVIAYTIGLVLCCKANYSEDILMGSIMGGCWTFANCAPFYPSVVNTITMQKLGTTTSAGMIPGLVSAVVMFIAIAGYLMWQVNRWKKKGRVFSAHEMLPKENEHNDYPPVWLSFVPLAAVMVLFNVFAWNISFAVIAGCILATLLTFKRHTAKEWAKIWEHGALECMGPVFALAAMSGIGGVVAVTPFYASIFDWIQTTTIHPYILTFAASNIMAFALGSGSSGVATCLPVLQPMFENWVAVRGLDMGNFHRLLVSGSVCLDSLPHNGTIHSMCEMFHTTQKKSYYPVLWTTVIIPLVIGSLITVPLAIMGLH